jgi:hypothetical protein
LSSFHSRALRARCAPPRPHGCLHRREIDHQTLSIVARPATLTAAAHRDLETKRPSELHGFDDVGDAAAAGDGGRPLVDQSGVDPPAIVVGAISRADELAGENVRGVRRGFCDR